MAASDAKPIPRKNVAHRVYFPIYDADGDPVTSATGLLGVVSIDGAAAATTTSAPIEIGATGLFIQDLTAAEMNGDGIVLKVTSSSAGAKASIIVLYPQENEDIKVSVTHWGSSPVASVGVTGIPKVDVTHWIGTAAATPTVAGVPEVDLTHISGSTESADRLERSTLAIVTGTVGVSSTATAIIFSALSPTSAVNDQFKGRIVTFDKDTTTTALRGQATDITAYTHATLTATVTALTTAPVSGDTCVIT